MYRTSYWRRGVGILVCGAPVFVLTASMVRAGGGASMTGTVAMIAALAIAVLNVYLSAVRPHVFRRRHGSLDGFRNISSIPLLGSLVTVVGAIVGFGSGVCAALGLLAVGLDVGGSPWLVIATWRDASFWDRPRG